MSVEILMPALSPTMEEGNLAKWHIKAGDKVESGQVIAEIETDKATMEVEAVDEGIVSEILVPAGTEGVKVNTPIARLGDGAANGAAPKANGVAAELISWSMACMAKFQVMNSTMGFSPAMAAPTPRPANPCSVMGVSITRRSPNSCSRSRLTL